MRAITVTAVVACALACGCNTKSSIDSTRIAAILAMDFGMLSPVIDTKVDRLHKRSECPECKGKGKVYVSDGGRSGAWVTCQDCVPGGQVSATGATPVGALGVCQCKEGGDCVCRDCDCTVGETLASALQDELPIGVDDSITIADATRLIPVPDTARPAIAPTDSELILTAGRHPRVILVTDRLRHATEHESLGWLAKSGTWLIGDSPSANLEVIRGDSETETEHGCTGRQVADALGVKRFPTLIHVDGEGRETRRVEFASRTTPSDLLLGTMRKNPRADTAGLRSPEALQQPAAPRLDDGRLSGDHLTRFANGYIAAHRGDIPYWVPVARQTVTHHLKSGNHQYTQAQLEGLSQEQRSAIHSADHYAYLSPWDVYAEPNETRPRSRMDNPRAVIGRGAATQQPIVRVIRVSPPSTLKYRSPPVMRIYNSRSNCPNCRKW